MAKGNLQRCLDALWPHEGGYVDHPRDPGGATNMGITIATLGRWRGKTVTKADVKALSKAEASRIYEANYWQPIRGDELPAGIDLSTMDYGVNSGTGRSARDLQRVLGVAVDGAIGPVTIGAAQRADARATIKAHCARRLSFVQGLKIWDTFGKGWSRRIASIEATALSWASSKSQLDADARDARNKAAGQGGAALGTGGSGVVVEQGAGMPIGVVIAIVVVVAGLFVVRAIINGQRASALAQAAREK